MTSKPTDHETPTLEPPTDDATPAGRSGPDFPLGAGRSVPVELPQHGAVDTTDRQNLMDTQSAPPRRAGADLRIPALDETPPTVEGGSAGPAEEGDVSEPDAGWFQSTQPPPDARSDSPEAARGIDPVMYVLGAIGLGVVVLGALALMG